MSEHTERVWEIQTDIHNLTADLGRAVATARSHGDTWQEIASALGVTRQAAQERFGQAKRQAHARRATASRATEPDPDQPTILEALDDAVEELESRVGPPKVTDDNPPPPRSRSVDAQQTAAAEQAVAGSRYLNLGGN